MKPWKIILKILVGVISIPIIVIFLLFLSFIFIPYIHSDLMSSTSPNSQYTIKVEYSGEHAWPFGAHTIHIYQKCSGDIFMKKVTKAEIQNDGKTPKSFSECLIEWASPSTAVVKLNGEEQAEEVIVIDCKNRKLISKQ